MSIERKSTQFEWTEASMQRVDVTDLYEPIQPWVFLAAVSALGARIVVDVGANVGFYSLVGSLAPSVATIIGFEAAPVAVEEFRKNVILNGLGGLITVEERAVSDHVGEAEFLIASELSGINALADLTMHPRGKYSATPVMVPLTSLDAYVTSHDLPSGAVGLKVDVEGAEASVFEGARTFLAERELVLQVEMYPGGRDKASTILRELGYERLLRCDNDWYWTNSLDLVVRWREVAEIAMTNCIRARMGAWPPVLRMG